MADTSTRPRFAGRSGTAGAPGGPIPPDQPPQYVRERLSRGERTERLRERAQRDVRRGGAPPPRGGRPRRRGTPVARARRELTPTGIARGTRRGAEKISGRGPYSSVLMAEMIAFLIVLGVRAVADYVPSHQGAERGTVTPKHNQAGPLEVLAGGIGSFLVLALVSRFGRGAARISAGLGGLIVLVLLLRSIDEIEEAATWLNAKHKEAAGSRGTTLGGEGFGPGSGTTPGSPQAPSGPPWMPIPASGKCPPGYTKAQGRCWSNAPIPIVPF